MKYVALLAIAWLTACAPSPSTPSPANQVFALKSSYTIALTAAVAYKGLPACPAAALCSDPVVLVDMRQLGDRASAAINAAETSVRSGGNDAAALSAAAQAVASFQDLTALHKVGK